MNGFDADPTEIDDQERAEVRRLIDSALGAEPAMGLQARSVLKLARRRELTVRFAGVGGVMTAVAAATVGVALMTSPSGAQEPVLPGGPVTGVESTSAVPPVTTTTPPTTPPDTTTSAPVVAPSPGVAPPGPASTVVRKPDVRPPPTAVTSKSAPSTPRALRPVNGPTTAPTTVPNGR